MKVWVATTGSYSGYHVVAVCDNEALAEDVGDNEPLEMEVLTEKPPRVRVWRAVGRVSVIDDGNYRVEESFIGCVPEDVRPPIDPRPEASKHWSGSLPGRMTCMITAVGGTRDEVMAAYRDEVNAIQAKYMGAT